MQDDWSSIIGLSGMDNYDTMWNPYLSNRGIDTNFNLHEKKQDATKSSTYTASDKTILGGQELMKKVT